MINLKHKFQVDNLQYILHLTNNFQFYKRYNYLDFLHYKLNRKNHKVCKYMNSNLNNDQLDNLLYINYYVKLKVKHNLNNYLD